MVIKAGESSHITATFNSAGRKGKQSKSITVITNDPTNHTTTLTIMGDVEKYKIKTYLNFFKIVVPYDYFFIYCKKILLWITIPQTSNAVSIFIDYNINFQL